MFELQCPCCVRSFTCAPESPTAQALDRLSAEGPWNILGDGETLEDVLYAALADAGRLHCPHCGEVVPLDGPSLGWLAQEVLLQW